MAAMMASYIIHARLGRYDPLIIKKNFEDDDQAIYLSTYQVQIQQENLDRIEKQIGLNFHKQYHEIEG